MEIKELRGKKKDELIKLLKEVRLELVKLRLDRKIGSLVDGSVINKKRRGIARILTVLREKEILGEVVKVAGEPKGAEVAKVSKKVTKKVADKKESKSRSKGTKNVKKKT